jgi:hypothetical protein
MTTRIDASIGSTLETAAHGAIGRLLERAGAEPSTTDRATGWRWLLAIAAAFVLWKAWRGFKSLFWTVFGLAMAVYWTGLWHRLF